MSEFLSDQEKEEQVKKWITTYGYNALMAVLLGLTAYFGYQYWQQSKANDNAQASNDFQVIRQQKRKIESLQEQKQPISKADNTKLLSDVDDLVKKYSNTVYAQQALMLKAQYFVEKNELKKAQSALSLAKTVYKDDKGIQNVLNLRIAKVLIADKQAQKALDTLATVTDDAFEASKQEIMGDAYIVLNKTEDAKKAYNTAWQKSLKEKDVNQLLRLKMETLGMTPNDKIEEASDAETASQKTVVEEKTTKQNVTKQVTEKSKAENNKLSETKETQQKETTNAKIAE